MSKIVYPIYEQNDSINTLYGQAFDIAEQSRQVTHTKGETKSSEKKMGLVLSLLQVLGLEASLKHENSENLGYTEEEMRVVGPEDKLRLIRKKLSEQGALYNLNLCLLKQRPFGSFVDFQAKASFILISTDLQVKEPPSETDEMMALMMPRGLVRVSGNIEDYQFTTVCSKKYFETSSWLYMTLTTEKNPEPKQAQIAGFGIVTDFEPVRKLITLKALMLALDPQGFSVR